MRDAIKKRVSTRTYLEEHITKNEIKLITCILDKYNNIPGPFGNTFTYTFSVNNNKEPGGKKIGTYGIIKNAQAFIGGLSKNNRESIIDFGYIFEYIILELTKMELGTCWMGGTFSRKGYQKILKDDEIIPAITPVGHIASRKTLIERVFRTGANSDNRLDYSELFMRYDNDEPLIFDNSNSILSSLELVRLGPSASNKQPWRILVDNNDVHFYIKRTPKYIGNRLGYDIQALDIGIALSHFEVGLKFHHIKYQFVREKHLIDKKNLEYVITVKLID